MEKVKKRVLTKIEIGTGEPKAKVETDATKTKTTLTSVFDRFKKTKSVHEEDDFVEEEEEEEEVVTKNKTKKKKGEEEEEEEEEEEKSTFNFEMQKIIFVKIANFMVTGIHVLIFNLISPVKVKFEELKLTEKELAELDCYITEEMVRILELLPAWVYPVANIEMMMYGKWQGVLKRHEVEKVEKEKKEEEEKKKKDEEEKKPKK